MLLKRPTLLPLGPTSRHLRVPTAWLRAEAEAGRVPHLKAGDRLLFNPDALERALLVRAQQKPSKSRSDQEVTA